MQETASASECKVEATIFVTVSIGTLRFPAFQEKVLHLPSEQCGYSYCSVEHTDLRPAPGGAR